MLWVQRISECGIARPTSTNENFTKPTPNPSKVLGLITDLKIIFSTVVDEIKGLQDKTPYGHYKLCTSGLPHPVLIF